MGNDIKLNEKTFFLFLTNEEEVSNIIKKLKNKGGRVDQIHASVLKHASNFIVEPLVHIINLSFTTGVFPSQLKKADIVPKHKSGSKKEVVNYSPISLISNIAKIIEKVMHSRILSFFEKHKLLSKYQFGFRKGIGKKDALASITSYIYEQ